MKKKLAIIGAICFVAFVVFGIIWINKGDKMVQLTEYGKQVAFLEDHKKEMTEFIKSQNPKIESVQFDWDSMEIVSGGFGTIEEFDIQFRVNHLSSDFAWHLVISADNMKNPKVIKKCLHQLV